MSTINHLSHNHALSEVNGVGTYTCDGCKLFGHGKTYRCDDCDYDLHEYCATCPQTLRNSLHGPDHELGLINGPTHMAVCYVCRFYIQGMFYKCNHCSFESHPLCTHVPMHASSPVATITKQRSLHGNSGHPSSPQHYGQGYPYGYPHMGPYGPYPHGGQHHGYTNPCSPKAEGSNTPKKKKGGGFKVMEAATAVAGALATNLFVATVTESVMNEP